VRPAVPVSHSLVLIGEFAHKQKQSEDQATHINISMLARVLPGHNSGNTRAPVSMCPLLFLRM
jgi:hypothetical protein